MQYITGPVLPDPKARSQGLLPHIRQEGVYKLYRAAFDSEIHFFEPNGDNFVLEHFDTERVLKLAVGLTEMEVIRAMDWLVNFRAISYNTRTRKLLILKDDKARNLTAELGLKLPPASKGVEVDRILTSVDVRVRG